jgi:hypothetical protein
MKNSNYFKVALVALTFLSANEVAQNGKTKMVYETEMYPSKIL